MTHTKNFLIGALALSACMYASAQSFQMNCVNPSLSVPVTLKGTNAKGVGEASSNLVQFNVVLPSEGGAIFVNENNDGVCRLRISSGYRVLNGSGYIDPVNISSGWVSNHGNQIPPSIATRISIAASKADVDTMVFNVRLVGNSDPGTQLEGTINVIFTVQYEAVQ